MAFRLGRVKFDEGGVYYHLCSRTAGRIGSYPFDNTVCRRRIIDFIHFFSGIFHCSVLGFSVMGNHYHLLIKMDERQKLSRDELHRRASFLYRQDVLEFWSESKWQRFEDRIFDVSELMRSLQSSIAKWFNQTFSRRGRFWSDRFKSTVYLDIKEALDCLMYVELNAVRAGLVVHPEDYEGSSLYLRDIGKDNWLVSATELTGINTQVDALAILKARIYYQGAIPTKANQAEIPEYIIKQEELRGFKSRGILRKRISHFVDGILVASEGKIRERLEKLRELEQYKRRKHPIPQLKGLHFSLREQRKNNQ